MAAPPTLKDVLPKRTVYSGETNSKTLKKYMDDCVTTGSVAPLFKDPNISSVFYGQITDGATAIKTAQDAYTLAPTKGNTKVIKAKMVLGVKLLDSYSAKVAVISNSDSNRTTREEAQANVLLSFLTPQKLAKATKGKPESPTFTCKKVDGNNVLIEVTNGVDYKPNSTTFVAVEIAPVSEPPVDDPMVSLDGDQINIILSGPSHVASQSNSGKGAFTTLKALKKSKYAIYGYSQNGKKLISDLSEPVIMDM